MKEREPGKIPLKQLLEENSEMKMPVMENFLKSVTQLSTLRNQKEKNKLNPKQEEGNSKEQTEVSEAKSWFFGKINTVDRHLVRWIQKKDSEDSNY